MTIVEFPYDLGHCFPGPIVRIVYNNVSVSSTARTTLTRAGSTWPELVAHFALKALAFTAPIRLEDKASAPGAEKACHLLYESFPQLVSFPGSEHYAEDNDLFLATSEQTSTCTVEPVSPDDVSAIIKLIGRPDVRAPFAVKSGGHAYNLGQSSTPGVQISMARFTNITHNLEQATVSVGVGLTWGEVYKRLEPFGVMVAGGRVESVGVGGYSLGDGYSWKTNQYGLLIDTIVSLDVILPSGELLHVTNTSEPDLFFGIKGGLNNFGIITDVTLESHNQSQVFGGSLLYGEDVIDSLNVAVSDFSLNNADLKAQIIVGYAAMNGSFLGTVQLFYDAPVPPPGVYDGILSVPALSSDVKTRSFVSFMTSLGSGDVGIDPLAAALHVIPTLQYPKALLDEMVLQVKTLGARLTEENKDTAVLTFVAAEPFLNPFSHSQGGAYPHPPTRQVTPAAPGIYYREDPETPLAAVVARQAKFVKELKNMTQIIQAKAVEQGVSRWDDILYPNYALSDTPLELLYGENVQRLQEIAARFDPDRVMALTGGFRFQTYMCFRGLLSFKSANSLYY